MCNASSSGKFEVKSLSEPLLQAIQIVKLTKLAVEELSDEKFSSYSQAVNVSYHTMKDK